MSIALRLTFPHRQYHATPWDQGANSGAVEWPPSPWRLHRALISVAYTRHFDVPMEDVLRVVHALTDPPTYWIPESRRGHTRHYMPESTQKTGENSTKLTLDAYVTLDPRAELVIGWPDAQLDVADRELLGKLVASLPYLGRAESIVEAHVSEALPESGLGHAAVWRPNPQGLQRLMCSEPGVAAAQLEIGPAQMRKSRRLLPEGCRWVSYEEEVSPVRAPRREPSTGPHVEVIRWRFVSPAPFRGVNAILATDRLRMIMMSVTRQALDREDTSELELTHPDPVPDRDAQLLSGHLSELTGQHRHAHWLWTEEKGHVEDLLLWVPGGLTQGTASRLARLAGYTGLSSRANSDGRAYVPAGFVAGSLNLVGWGGREVLDDLLTATHTSVVGGRKWVSATPHLLVRRGKKNQSLADLATEDVTSELAFRFGAEAPRVVTVRVTDRQPAPRLYRRQRWTERLSSTAERGSIHNRFPVWIEVEFAEHVEGPLILGGLSHFGFGRLVPTAS